MQACHYTIAVFKGDIVNPFDALPYCSKGYTVSQAARVVSANLIPKFVARYNDMERLRILDSDSFNAMILQKKSMPKANKEQLAEKFIFKVREKLGREFTDFVQETEEYKQLEREYQDVVTPYQLECQKLLSIGVYKYFYEFDLGSEINLNPYML